jgi:hypothetical protein
MWSEQGHGIEASTKNRLACISQPVLSPGRALEPELNAGLALPVSIDFPQQTNRTPAGY